MGKGGTLMYFNYLFDGAHWHFDKPGSIPNLILQHLGYTFVSVLIAMAIALPLGAYIGHTNKGAFLAINIANAGRALPTFGLVTLLVTLIGLGTLPVVIALVVLSIPPILANTYAGLRAVEPGAVDAARGMGMRPARVLLGVEVPMAMPLIMAGLRSAVLQVVATATIAAYVGGGGIGRLLIDGLSIGDYSRVVAGAVVVAVLAIVLEVLMTLLERAIVSPGVSGRFSVGGRKGADAVGRDPSDLLGEGITLTADGLPAAHHDVNN
ncbi:MAG: ABC transporter permease [Antricoccus sp.]